MINSGWESCEEIMIRYVWCIGMRYACFCSCGIATWILAYRSYSNVHVRCACKYKKYQLSQVTHRNVTTVPVIGKQVASYDMLQRCELQNWQTGFGTHRGCCAVKLIRALNIPRISIIHHHPRSWFWDIQKSNWQLFMMLTCVCLLSWQRGHKPLSKKTTDIMIQVSPYWGRMIQWWIIKSDNSHDWTPLRERPCPMIIQ